MSFQVDAVVQRRAAAKWVTPGWCDRALGWVEWVLDAVGGFMAGPDGERASRWLAYISIVALAVIVAAAWWRGSR